MQQNNKHLQEVELEPSMVADYLSRLENSV